MSNACNMYNGEVSIVGVRPLLWHHFGPEVLSLEKKERKGVAGNDPDEWRSTVLVTASNQLYIEPTYLFGCIRDGAKYTKRGRGSLQPLVSATLQINEDIVLLERYLPDNLSTDRNMQVYLDIKSVRNPTTKGGNIRYRVAASPGWKANFKLSWDKTIISRTEMESIIRDAGMFSGLGDGRSIGYGRFEIEEFRVM